MDRRDRKRVEVNLLETEEESGVQVTTWPHRRPDGPSLVGMRLIQVGCCYYSSSSSSRSDSRSLVSKSSMVYFICWSGFEIPSSS